MRLPCSFAAHALIEQDPRNNSAWNQRWFAIHRAKKEPLPWDEVARHEADYAIHTGATLDPFNESPWRYLIGLLKEVQEDNRNEIYAEYEEKAYSLRAILSDAHRDPDTCTNLTSARIDLLEMIGNEDSLKKVSSYETLIASLICQMC